MDVTYCSKTSVDFELTTWCYISEGITLQLQLCLTIMEEPRLRVFEIRVLRRTFGSERDGKKGG
jgi:hypothetical protein